MLSLIGGILILIIVLLALVKSLLAHSEPGALAEDEDYPEDVEDIENVGYADAVPGQGRRVHERADEMIDDFVLQDAVDEEHDLTGVWEDEGRGMRDEG